MTIESFTWQDFEIHTIRLTWSYAVKIWRRNSVWHRVCSWCHQVAWVYDAPGALGFISRPDFVCADCRTHQERITLAPLATLRSRND